VAFQSNFHSFVFVCLVSGFVPAGCARILPDIDGEETETGDGDADADAETDAETGDGDADPDAETGDGDADPDAETGDGDTGDGDSVPDATYLLAIETTLGPDLPLQFVLDVFNSVHTNDGVTADLSFQPLSLDQGETTPGECVGQPLVLEDVSFDDYGNFVIDMGLVMISGETNPVTGSDIEATMILSGYLAAPDAMCGDMQGILTSPLEYDLTGSQFAAIPLAGGCDANPFPAPIYKCSML
jgi:hypothetical protein